MMSASAMARSKGLGEYHCAVCAQVASGTKHLALHIPGLAHIRNDAQFQCGAETSDFTECAGIPETPSLAGHQLVFKLQDAMA